MRTPGLIEILALGFSFYWGIIKSAPFKLQRLLLIKNIGVNVQLNNSEEVDLSKL